MNTIFQNEHAQEQIFRWMKNHAGDSETVCSVKEFKPDVFYRYTRYTNDRMADCPKSNRHVTIFPVIKKIIKTVFLILLLLILLTGAGIPLITCLSSYHKIVQSDEAPQKKVAIVFGAGLQPNGRPSPILSYRVKTAVELYKKGKVQYLLMSGDNRFVDYNEPGAMKSYAIELGVPEEHIVLDYAGRRTYDTCYRAKAIFGVQEALLVTQRYHLPRALFICNELGLNAIGVEADPLTQRPYSMLIWCLREIPAQWVAVYDVWFRHPLPILGPYEPIE